MDMYYVHVFMSMFRWCVGIPKLLTENRIGIPRSLEENARHNIRSSLLYLINVSTSKSWFVYNIKQQGWYHAIHITKLHNETIAIKH